MADRDDQGQFTNNSDAASEAGQKGGSQTGDENLSHEDKVRGGKNSGTSSSDM
jgi:general stress protein YciG